MSFVYILECGDGSFYTGSTWNLNLRIQQHYVGQGSTYTKRRLPVKLVHFEEYERMSEAFAREKQIQKWRREKKIALINQDFERLARKAPSQ